MVYTNNRLLLYTVICIFRLDFPCPNCLVPHPDCSMCMAYKKTYGNSFLRHRFSSDIKRVPPKTSPSPSSIRMKTRKSKSTMPKARARIPITSPGSSEDDESYRAAFAVASQRRENGSTMFGRSSNGGISPSKDINRSRDYVRDTVKDLLKKNDSVLVCFISVFFNLASFLCKT